MFLSCLKIPPVVLVGATHLKLFVKLPVSKFYWNGQLKKNGAYERRFAQPLT
jgi:hypothetical protein